ncbi:MAG TPA: FAD-dependent oxidoreductase, partial [Saprospiraceae bacterium]|nr:FAD-dependent oxidoreductase [Saprospiraceae bacterium]
MRPDYSFWEAETYHERWDVCIIGSGITGLSTGISLLEKNPELKVLVADRWFIPLGASTRNAGFSCFGSPSEILDDIEHMGEKAAVDLVIRRWQGLKKLRSRLDLSYAQYQTSGGYELYQEEQFTGIMERLPYLNELLADGLQQKEVFKVKDVPAGIRGFSRSIYNDLEGQLHPGYMMENLKRIYLDMGGRMLTGLMVESIEDQDEGLQLLNRTAVPIEAKKVVITTNAFARQLVPELEVHGARNHVMVTSPLPDLAWKGCYHFDKGFYYFRNIGRRILLGGARNKDLERENTEQFGFNPIIAEELERFLFTHLADRSACSIDYRWSGIIGIGGQKSPIIKALSPKLFVGVRLS